jgi:hypothetical protein
VAHNLVWPVFWGQIFVLSILNDLLRAPCNARFPRGLSRKLMSYSGKFGRLGTILLFVAVVFLGDRALSLTLEKLVSISSQRVAALYGGRIQTDVLMIGNSRMVNLAPSYLWSRLLCSRTYNLGLNGLDPWTMAALIGDFIDRNRKPKVVVIEVSNVMEFGGIMAQALLPLVDVESRTSQLIEENDQRDVNWSRWLHLYRFNGEMFLRGLYYLFRSSDQDWTGENGLINQSMIEIAQTKPLHYSYEKNRLAPLLHMIENLDAQNIRSIIVLAPYHPAALKGNDGVAKFVNLLRKNLPKSTPMFDFSHELPDNEYYSDPYHMNEIGAAALFDLGIKRGLFTAINNCEK